jgi:DNA topoisomerase IB
VRLRGSDPGKPGCTRRRRGKGFTDDDRTGAMITDQPVPDRIRALVIPPARREVWICPDPRGRIQAVGTDAAGRRHSRCHDVWRAQRDAAKFDHVLEVGRSVSRTMREVAGNLGNTPAVVKASYVDPRVVDLFHDGTRITPVLTEPGGVLDPEGRVAPQAVEAAVLGMLRTGAEPDGVHP